MNSQQSAGLAEAVRAIAERVRHYREQYRDRGLGEENTKAALISPLLEALGWNIRDPDEVHHEYRPTPKDNPVDYCLRLERSPKLLVEAKGLGEDLSDRKWILQTLSYATMAGVEWCVLTDGDNYILYNATAPVEADQKLFRHIRLSEDQEEVAAKTLSLISRSNMSGPILKELWQRYHADRRVRAALRELVDAADRKLVLLIRRRIEDLSPKEISEAIRRMDIKIEAHEDLVQPTKGSVVPSKVPGPKPKKLKHQGAERLVLRKRFWGALLTRPKAMTTRHAKIMPSEYSWIGAGSGVRGLHFVYAIKQQAGRVELWIDRGVGKRDENKEIFTWFEKLKEQIERAFGSRLLWEPLPEKRGCRIAFITTHGGYRSEESKWPEIQDSMIDAMVRLEKALSPYLLASVKESQ